MYNTNLAIHLIKNLVSNESIVYPSLSNYHLKGIDIIRLFKSPLLRVDLYFFDKERFSNNQFLPCSHSEDRYYYCIGGNFKHNYYAEKDDVYYDKYKWSSSSVELDSEISIKLIDSIIINSKQSFFVYSRQIHSICPNPNTDSVMAVFKFPKNKDSQFLYSQGKYKKEEDLFGKMTDDNYKKALSATRDLLWCY